MQKIIIKNFRAIEYAEIELKKVLVLIGAQASGKSTIAKLIYFFKTIQDDFFVQVYESGNTDLEKLVRRKFLEFFGLVKMDFELEFWFDKEKSIYIKGSENGQIEILIKNIFSFNNTETLNQILEKKAAYKELPSWHKNQFNWIESLKTLLNEIFNDIEKDNLYVIAGRNVTVSYSNIFIDYFERKLQLELSAGIEANLKDFDSTDEKLMLRYIQRIDSIKRVFKNSKTFQGVIDDVFLLDNFDNFKNEKFILEKIKNQAEKILKSKYKINNDNEQLVLKNGKSIALSDASSGQQEVIRILQDLFLTIRYKYKFLRIIEEPEAHLFPIAQKELIELLALAVNYQPENQLIIATHSPYILSVFNNLLFANEVATKDESLQGEVSEIIDKDFSLKAEDFSAYTLGGEDAYCESIMSEDGGMIDQNYLDEVSEMLGMEYYTLREIYRKKLQNKR